MTHCRTLLAVPMLAWFGAMALAASSPVESDANRATDAGAGDGSDSRGSVGVTDAIQGRDGLRIQTLCTHCNSANVQLGGLSRDLVPMSRDGFPLVGGLATSMVLTMLPADSIAGTSVVRGPGDAGLSHTAAGGEVDLVGASADETPGWDLFAAGGSYALRQAVVRVGETLSKGLRLSVIVGTTGTDPVNDDGDEWNDVPGVDRTFADMTLELASSDASDLLLGISYVDEENPEGRGAFDAVRYVTTQSDGWTREDAFFSRLEARAGWTWRQQDGGALELRGLVARRDQTQRSQLTAQTGGFFPGADRLIDRFRIEEDNLWASATYSRPLGLEWRLALGVETSRQQVDAENREPLTVISGNEVEPQVGRESVDVRSSFVDVEWMPSSAVAIQLGARYDQAESSTALSDPRSPASSSTRAASQVSPRITLRYFPAPGWSLRFVAGDTFRPPKPILAEVCCGQRYQTTELVRPERGTTAAFEATYAPTPRLSLTAYAARTEFEDHIVRLVGWSQVFIQTYALANIPTSVAERAEIAMRWSPTSRLQLDAGIGRLSFENVGNPEVDVFVTPPSFGAPQRVAIRIERVPYQPDLTASLGLRFQVFRRTFLSWQGSYTGGQLIQQFERLPQNSRLDTSEMRQTPGFWLLNFTAEIPLSRTIGLTATINNLTNELQNDLADPTTDYNWGPLAGRSWRLGLRFHFGDKRADS